MRINREKILEFYDRKRTWPSDTGSPITAVTGMIGEDLVLGLLCRYLDGKIISYGCKPRGASGRRLDAWVFGNSLLYQVEVKNWCAHSLGSSNNTDLRSVAEHNLKVFLTEARNIEPIWKILGTMHPPSGFENMPPIPLLALWAPVAASTGQHENPLPYWFECSLSDYRCIMPIQYRDTAHQTIQIFSASLYLHSLKEPSIEIEMPRAESRLSHLDTLIAKNPFMEPS